MNKNTFIAPLSKKGFSLIEVLIALGVLSFLSLASMQLLDYARKESLKQNALTQRNTELSQFFMLFGDPNYVGSLAAYEQNKSLKECLSVDAIICDSKIDYPLVAYDLATGKVLSSVNPDAAKYVQTEFSFRVHCPLDQPSCEQADYINITILASIFGTGGKEYSTTRVVTVSPKMTNVLTFIPNTQVEEGHPVNVILFVDGSNSMSAIKDSFKTSLAKLMSSFQNMDVTLAIYSINEHTEEVIADPTQYAYTIDGFSNKTYYTSASVKSLPEDTIFYQDKITKFRYGIKYVIGSSADPSQSIFSFSSKMSDADRTTTLTRIQAKIDQIFIDGLPKTTVDDDGNEVTPPAPDDAPLCGMLRILDDLSKGSSSLSVDPATPTVFMLLSNEDDQSHFYSTADIATAVGSARCVSKVTTRNKALTSGDSGLYGNSYTQVVGVNNEKMVDGAPVVTPINVKIKLAYPTPYASGDNCLADVKSNPAALEAALPAGSTKNYTITSCKVTIQKGILFAEYDFNNTNFCTSDQFAKSSLYKYLIPGTCIQKDYFSWWSVEKSVSVTEALIPSNVVDHVNNDLPAAIYNLIMSKYKLNNFYYVAVINPLSGVCPLTAGAALGSKYESLVNKLGAQGQVVPICSPEFDSKMVQVQTYLASFGVGDFKLAPMVVQAFSGADVLRGDKVLNPTDGVDYTLNNGLLVFSSGYLQPTDIVRVYTK